MRGERGGVAELLSPPSPQESLVVPRPGATSRGLIWLAAWSSHSASAGPFFESRLIEFSWDLV